MIIVDKNYCIDVDKNCYTVKIDKHKTNKKGEKIYETVGYFTSLAGAIKGIINSMNKSKFNEGVYTLEEAIKVIAESNEHFEKLLEKVMGEK